MFRGMRTLAIAWVLLCVPATLFVIGWGLRLIHAEAGMVVFLICCAIVGTGGLAIAHLYDTLEKPRSRQPRGQ